MESVAPWLGLLVLQPSPFCNIDCDYCYLPARMEKRRMSWDVLEASIRQVYEADIIQDVLNIVWHAGEPLAVPREWYREAFQRIKAIAPDGAEVRHSFQSNGTLVSQEWCDFFKEHNVMVGLSIDGPEHIHDAHRKTRGGKGTHAGAMRAMKLLKQNGIDFHVIAVITKDALDYPDEVFNFFLHNEVHNVGFNIEEVEGNHVTSTLTDAPAGRVEKFLRRIFELETQHAPLLEVREFANARELVRMGAPPTAEDGYPWYNDQARPFGILAVDTDGNISTFSPELLGLKHERFGVFSFGNILREGLYGAMENEKFKLVLTEINAGIKKCATTCPYYEFCGGGAPANKLYENGTFDSSETMYCRYTTQLPLELTLDYFEKKLAEEQITAAAGQMPAATPAGASQRPVKLPAISQMAANPR
ncbi:MAG: cyclophane-forming radical SAM/SPASM peptide maturase GrrM/OscB [Candidatus Methylacidiphilales bacterium]|nr:cyclophane-forming radical SAM/SPASM peptide maturase GrrM/OscB [Candidatus Methylacidiphilales bacterium]